MDYFILAVVFAFGAIIGSFLNVIILRHDTGLSALRGRSQCFSCGNTLTWSELIPVLSFLFQRGRCRGCGTKISWQYPLVEVAGGFSAVIAYLFAIPEPNAYGIASFVLILSLLSIYTAICVYDFRHKIIPDRFSFAAALVALALAVLNFKAAGAIDVSVLVAGPALFCFYGFFWLVSRGKWMGLGDAKLALSVGWALGAWEGISAVLLSFWTGAVIALVLMAIQRLGPGKRLGWKSEIPFGPFIILGFLISFLFHTDIQSILAFLAV